MEYQKITQTGYDNAVELYASMFDNKLEDLPFTKAMLTVFSELVRGTDNKRVADIGCGPGHITALLNDYGLDAEGYDLSPGMVNYARQHHPPHKFQQASMDTIPVEDGTYGGVVAHYSMIHITPDELPKALDEQHRILSVGGFILVSFFWGALRRSTNIV